MTIEDRLCLVGALRLTDFNGGFFENEATGKSVPATDFTRQIVQHFETGGQWDGFPHQAEGQTAFDGLKQAGLLVSQSAPPSAPLLVQSGLTMFTAPTRALADVSEGEIVFVGAPVDLGTTGYPGARFGPEAIRMASLDRYRCDYDVLGSGLKPWNMPNLGGAIMTGARMSDLGDVAYEPGTLPGNYYDKLRAVLDQIYSKGAFPVVLGGDHSITYGTVHPKADILMYLDAHSDMALFDPQNCHHHGNVLSRVTLEGLSPRIVHMGLRDTSGADTADAGSVAFASNPSVFGQVLDGVAGKSVFVSLDVDVLDPSILPGTGTPVPGGLQVRELCGFLAQLVEETRPLGLDVVELCPMRDTGDMSARVVVEIVLVFLAMYHKHHGPRSAV